MSKEAQQIDHPTNEEDQKWIKIIEEWRQSGLSITEWCRGQENISYSYFNYQRKRLFPKEIRKSEFMEQPTTWSTLTMELPSSSIDIIINECRVIVNAGFDQELLREVVEVLKNDH